MSVEQAKFLGEHARRERLAGFGALGGAEQVRTKPLDQHRGVGAPGVAVTSAELLHACLTDASGLLRCGVVGPEVESDVAVQTGEQVQRRGGRPPAPPEADSRWPAER